MFLVGLFLLQGLDVQIPANLCSDLISLCLAPDDVHVFAGCEAEIVPGGDDGGGIGGKRLFAVAVSFACIDADVRESLLGKGCTDACRAEFVLRCGDACILARFKAHVPLGAEGDVRSCDGTALDGQVTLTRSDIGIPA